MLGSPPKWHKDINDSIHRSEIQTSPGTQAESHGMIFPTVATKLQRLTTDIEKTMLR